MPSRTASRRELSNPVTSPRSTKEKKPRSSRTPAKTTPRYSCVLGVRELMGVLAIVGPLGTVVSLWVVPQGGSMMDGLPVTMTRHSVTTSLAGGAHSTDGGERVPRVIHLTMAQNDRKARYILAPDVDWDQFVGGVQERLQLGAISRIETSAGERIMSVEDLMHDDHLVIHSDFPLPNSRGRQLFQQDAPDERKILPRFDTSSLANGLQEAPPEQQLQRPGSLGQRRQTLADDVGGSVLPPQLFKSLRRRKSNATASGGGGGGAAGGLDALDGGGGGGPGTLYGAPPLYGGPPLSLYGGEDGQVAAAAGLGGAAAGAGGETDAAMAMAGGAPSMVGAAGGEAGGAAFETDAAWEASHAAEIEEARERQRRRQRQFQTQQQQEVVQSQQLIPHPDGVAEAVQVGTPCGESHPELRLGMIIPWVGPLPIWASYFVSSARLSSPIADFLIFHEGQAHLVPRGQRHAPRPLPAAFPVRPPAPPLPPHPPSPRRHTPLLPTTTSAPSRPLPQTCPTTSSSSTSARAASRSSSGCSSARRSSCRYATRRSSSRRCASCSRSGPASSPSTSRPSDRSSRATSRSTLTGATATSTWCSATCRSSCARHDAPRRPEPQATGPAGWGAGG